MNTNPTIVTLSNGKRVANFSSPHPFEFEDGNVLPAHSPESANQLKVEFIEKLINDDGDVLLTFELSPAVNDEMTRWMTLYREGQVDVVFCPLPMITAIKGNWSTDWLYDTPFRAVRIEDRINKKVSIWKQCL